MNKKHILLFLCWCSFILFGQQKNGSAYIDSIIRNIPSLNSDTEHVNSLIRISITYQKINSDKSLSYARQSLQKAASFKWHEGSARSLCYIGENYLIAGEYDKALKSSLLGLSLAKNKKTIGHLYRNVAEACRSKAQYSKALFYSFKSLSICEELKDSINIIETYTLIGSIYYFTDEAGDFEKALIYYNKALQIGSRVKTNHGLTSILQKKGALYAAMGKDSIAISYFEKSLNLSREENDINSIAINKYSTSAINMASGNFEKALEDINEAKQMTFKINNSSYYAAIIGMEADIYIEMAQAKTGKEKKRLLTDAEPLLLEAITLNKKSNNFFNLIRHYKHLSGLYDASGDYKKAKEAYVIYSDVRDSIYSIKSRETIKDLESQRVIELKNKELQLQQVSIELKEKQKWYFIASILLLFVIGLMLVYQNRNRKKSNEALQLLNTELEQANNIKTRFFSILNHDLRTPVSNLLNYLHLKANHPELLNEESRARMEFKTISAAENLLVSMEDLLLWSKGQMENFKTNIVKNNVDELFQDLQNHFLSSEHVAIKFESTNHITINTDLDYLKTIMRNLTSNAIKALDKTPDALITWKAWSDHSKSYLSITDNGSGATKDQFKALYSADEVVGIKTGLGLHLIRDLAKAIDCIVSVNSTLNEGTTIVLTFVVE